MRPHLVVRVAFVVYVAAFAGLFALIARDLLERTLHVIP